MGTLDTGMPLPLSAAIEVAEAGRALAGETVSGDACLVRRCERGVLLAVCDGLGHGPEAAAASAAALAALRLMPADAELAAMFDACHQATLRTRGVAMTLAFLDSAQAALHWAGVGNVDAVLLRRDGTGTALLCRGGVVGYRMPPPRVEVLPLHAADLIVIVTDGIVSRFSSEIDRSQSCGVVAQNLLRCCARDNDDALVLAARWPGG